MGAVFFSETTIFVLKSFEVCLGLYSEVDVLEGCTKPLKLRVDSAHFCAVLCSPPEHRLQNKNRDFKKKQSTSKKTPRPSFPMLRYLLLCFSVDFATKTGQNGRPGRREPPQSTSFDETNRMASVKGRRRKVNFCDLSGIVIRKN